MVVLSILLHLAIFSVTLFVPEAIPIRSLAGVVYEVDLVEMPSRAHLKSGRATSAKRGKGKPILKGTTKAKRIKAVEKKKRPLVIAKRTVETKRASLKKPRISPSQMIDKAISRVERKVQEKKGPPPESAISRLERESPGPYRSGPTEGQPVSWTAMQIYAVEVEEWIKSHWSYPVALRGKKDLEAIVVLTVKRDGSIAKTEIKKRSSDGLFDQSVIKAIKRSDPLPPFPEAYRKSHDEFQINFNLKELEGH